MLKALALCRLRSLPYSFLNFHTGISIISSRWALISRVLLIAVFRLKTQENLFLPDSLAHIAYISRRVLGSDRVTHRRAV